MREAIPAQKQTGRKFQPKSPARANCDNSHPPCYLVRTMRMLILFALFLGVTLPGVAQSGPLPQPEQIKDPRAILAAAAAYYDFNDPSLRPFHLKATYQLYDDKGKPSEQGTFEYWWASPKVHRSTWSRPSATHTSWHTADGKEAYITTGENLRYFERGLPSDLFSPLPNATSVDPLKTRLLRNQIKLSGASYPCVSERLLKFEESADFRMLPTSCFEPMSPILRFGFAFTGAVTTTYNNVVRFQGKFLAKTIEVVAGHQNLFTVAVSEISPIDPADPVLMPPQYAVFKPDSVESTGQIGLGSLVKKERPRYPEEAKEQHVQGIVLIEATIAIDGRIKNPSVIFSSSPLLSSPSLEAVSHWEYKPYLLDGTPVEVETIVAEVFSLGP
jgi:Gram-negative bacterial TonB protein C-terminal